MLFLNSNRNTNRELPLKSELNFELLGGMNVMARLLSVTSTVKVRKSGQQFVKVTSLNIFVTNNVRITIKPEQTKCVER
jgi:hypothetical protein